MKLYFISFKEWWSNRTVEFWVLSYGAIALLTFGFSSVEHQNENASILTYNDAQCGTIEDRVSAGSICYTRHKDYNPDTIVGIFSGIFWPLYWTKKVFVLFMPGPTLPTVVTKTVVKKEYIFPEEVTATEDTD